MRKTLIKSRLYFIITILLIVSISLVKADYAGVTFGGYNPNPQYGLNYNITNYFTNQYINLTIQNNFTNNITYQTNVSNNITNNISNYYNTTEIDPLFSANFTIYSKFWYNMSSGAAGTYNSSYDALIKWGYNQTYSGSIFNITYQNYAYNQTYSGSTFNSSYAVCIPYAYNQTYSGSTYNSSYDNGIKYQYNMTTASIYYYNQTYSGSTYNSSYNGALNNASYLSTYNATYDGLNTSYNKWWYNMTPTSTGADNSSWNQTYANTLYVNQSAYNPTTYNSSYDNGIKYQYNFSNVNPMSYYNSTTASTIPIFNSSYASSLNNGSYLSTYNVSYDGSLNNASYLSTYNATYAAITGGNASWNQTYANTLYASSTAGNASWNQSYANTLYVNQSAYNPTTYNVTYDTTSKNALVNGSDAIHTNINFTSNLYDRDYSFLYNATSDNLKLTNNMTASVGNFNYIIINNSNYLNTLFYSYGNVAGFSEINIQNINNTGNASSADFVATSNIGDAGDYYVNLGINNNNYNQSQFALERGNESYLYSSNSSLMIAALYNNLTYPSWIYFAIGSANQTSNLAMNITQYGNVYVYNNLTVINSGFFNALNFSGDFVSADNALRFNGTSDSLTITKNITASLLFATNICYTNGTGAYVYNATYQTMSNSSTTFATLSNNNSFTGSKNTFINISAQSVNATNYYNASGTVGVTASLKVNATCTIYFSAGIYTGKNTGC